MLSIPTKGASGVRETLSVLPLEGGGEEENGEGMEEWGKQT